MTARTALTKFEYATLFLAQQGKCAICGNRLEQGNIHDDHRIALALGGTNDLSNRQLICRKPCHAVKTHGTKATSLNSDIHSMAKVKRLIAGPRKSKRPVGKSRGFQGSRKFNGTPVYKERT